MKKITFTFTDGPVSTTDVRMVITNSDGSVCENALSYTDIEIIASRDPRHIINRTFAEAAERFISFMLLKGAIKL